MTFDIEREIDALIKREGGYSNDPDDSGGETMFGVTVAIARENGYLGQMKEMPLSVAKSIYRKRYWTGPKFDLVAQLSPAIAAELFDTGVNMGPPKASEFLQMALNAFNQEGSRYPDIAEDASIGSRTIDVLRAYIEWRGAEGESVMVRALNCLQGARYVELSRTRHANEKYVYGWINERVVV